MCLKTLFVYFSKNLIKMAAVSALVAVPCESASP